MMDKIEQFSPDRVLELGQEYGSVDAIPDEVLNAHSYERIAEGHVAPLGSGIRATTECIATMEDKIKAAPFKHFQLEVPGTRVTERVLGQSEIDNIVHNLNEIAEFNFMDSDDMINDVDFPLAVNLRRLEVDVEQFISESAQFSQHHNWISIYLVAPVRDLAASCEDIVPLPNVDEYFSPEGDDYLNMTAQNADELSTALERYKSRLTDAREIERLYGVILNSELEWSNEETHILKFCQERGIKTNWEVVRYFFARYLENIGEEHLAASLEAIKRPTDFANLIDQRLADPTLSEKLYNLRGQYRASSPKTKKSLSKDLQVAKKEFKQKKALLNGMKDYVTLPSLLATSIEKMVGQVQKHIRVGSAEPNSIRLEFDAVPNLRLDKNPGLISGDCTEDVPLPFDVPDIPIYNVKVRENGQHVGNIYLLVTKQKNGEKIWHLDAIQIPNIRIDWPNFPQLFIGALAPLAAESNVGAITCNDTLDTISNYRYISEAFEKNSWDEDYDLRPKIHIPPVPDGKKYSSFQGHGTVRYLWRDPNRPHDGSI